MTARKPISAAKKSNFNAKNPNFNAKNPNFNARNPNFNARSPPPNYKKKKALLLPHPTRSNRVFKLFLLFPISRKINVSGRRPTAYSHNLNTSS